MRTKRVGRSRGSAMTPPPASGPFSPVTTPAMSSPSIGTAAGEPCCVLVAPAAKAHRAATTTARIICVLFINTPRLRAQGSRLKSSEQRPRDEPHVRRPFRKASHIPREPVFSIADEDTQSLPLLSEPRLLVPLDAVQHRELVGGGGHPVVANVGGQSIGQRNVVCRNVQERARLARVRRQQARAEFQIIGIDV